MPYSKFQRWHTHYLYALPHDIRLVAVSYRANVFPSQLLVYLDKSSKPPFFLGQSRQLLMDGLLLRLIDFIMTGFLAEKHAEYVVGQLDQLAIGGKTSISTHLKSLILPANNDRGGTHS